MLSELLLKSKKALDTCRRSLDETLFVSTPVPGILSPLAFINNGLDALRGPRVSAVGVKKAASTACETARQACKHVEIEAGRQGAWPNMPRQQVPSYYQNYGYGYGSPQLSELDKAEMLRALAGNPGVMQKAAEIDAMASAARAARALGSG